MCQSRRTWSSINPGVWRILKIPWKPNINLENLMLIRHEINHTPSLRVELIISVSEEAVRTAVDPSVALGRLALMYSSHIAG